MRKKDVEGIVLSEVNQRKTNIVLCHLYVESKEAEIVDTKW